MKYIKIILIVSTAFFLSACGNGNGNNKWLDNTDSVAIPSCGADSSENSIILNIEDKVIPLTEDTSVRIWYYENSDKVVCVVEGEAVVNKVEN